MQNNVEMTKTADTYSSMSAKPALFVQPKIEIESLLGTGNFGT